MSQQPTHDAPPDDEIHDHDRGLSFDLPRLMDRRRALGLLGAGGLAAALVACGSSSSDSSATSTTATTAAAAGASTSTAAGSGSASGSTAIPEETGGPFPGDGSNGPNVLTESGVVRRDLTRSFGDASGVAEGVPTTVVLTLIDVAGGGGPLAGAAVYLWHCNAAGEYSLYTGAAASENYLRGVQESDAEGTVTFDTIFPAAYDGRWPHMHFEIYDSLATATKAGSKLRTTQLALPQATCELVYAGDGYDGSTANLARTSLDTDMVFRDGYASELTTATGTVADGFTVKLNVGV